MSTRSATPASSARARARSACGPDSVMPVTWTPWLTAACTAKLPQPQPTSSRRSPGAQAELGAHAARAWSPGPPRASWPRARRSRSCRSSTRRGRARRTPPAGRSGGAPSAGRARSSAGAPRARALTAGRGGGRSRPIARAAASARRALVGAVQRRRLPGLQEGDRRVDVVDVELAGHVGPAEPELAGGVERVGDGARRAHREARPGRRRRHLGAVPEGDAERTLGERLRQRAAQWSGLREGQRLRGGLGQQLLLLAGRIDAYDVPREARRARGLV